MGSAALQTVASVKFPIISSIHLISDFLFFNYYNFRYEEFFFVQFYLVLFHVAENSGKSRDILQLWTKSNSIDGYNIDENEH